MEAVIVVGDRFEHFAEDKANVLTMKELSEVVWNGAIEKDRPVILGQGVEPDRLHGMLLTLKRRHGLDLQVQNLEQVCDLSDPAHRATVHKHRPENILVSRPKAVDDDHYVAALCVQDSSEFLGDHMTGQHLQGILLAEAARQMLLTTSEHHLLDPEAKGRSYFVLNTFDTEFLRFAFPLPTRINFSVLREERQSGHSLRVVSETTFFQDGNMVAKVSCKYCAYAAAYIAEKEAELAIAACSGTCAGVSTTARGFSRRQALAVGAAG